MPTLALTCSACSSTLNDHESKLQCEQCSAFFHKTCTDRKSKSGRSPKGWKCDSCAPITTVSNIPVNDSNVLNHFPALSGKHKKSNICNHPNTEFLEMQIASLKSSLSMKELEFTKLKQSDALKAKQIVNLEAKLQESLKALNNNTDKNSDVLSNTEKSDYHEQRSLLLENKVEFLQQQLDSLTSRIDTFMIHTYTSNQNREKDVTFACVSCPFETKERDNLKTHQQLAHNNQIICESCDYICTSEIELITHRKNWHAPALHTCNDCDFKTIHADMLTKHIKEHENDIIEVEPNKLRITCDFCAYNPFSKQDLTRHIRVMHRDKQESRTFNRSRSNTNNYKVVQRPAVKPQYLKEKKSESFPVNINSSSKEATPSSVHQYACDKSCNRWQYTFSHKDELELHMSYYHTIISEQ